MKLKNRKKAIVLCAAFVAAGVGMNVQNAIAGYGMDQDVVSLVASGSSNSGSNGSSNVNSNVTNSNSSNGEEPEFWDFFNNYFIEERIPINTKTCIDGKVLYKGVKYKVKSCTKYTYAIYRHCYDGGKKDLCTSSHVHAYI